MNREKYLKYGLYGLLCFLIISIIILSSVPPVSRDALTHHLAVPKLYLQHGGMYEIPTMKFSYYPMNLELLYMLPLYFGNDIIPKWIHFLFALGTAWIIYVYLKKKLNILYALFGALLFLSIPIIVKLSITAYVDLGLIFFSTASFILLLKWAEDDNTLKYLLGSAICCGLALGTKYNGLVVLFLFTFFTPILYIHRNQHRGVRLGSVLTQSRAVGYGFIFFVVALIFFSPWMARNYLWKKNPIYPLYHGVITSNMKTEINEKQTNKISAKLKYHFLQNAKGRWNHFLVRRIIYKENWWQIALIPIRIFFQGEDGNPKHFDGRLNPVLLILPLFAFIGRQRDRFYLKRDMNWLLAFSICYLIYSFIARDMRIRYIGPIIPPLIILAVFGCKRMEEMISDKCPKTIKRFCIYGMPALVTLFMLINVSYLIGQFNYVKPFDYICGKLTREQYITKFRPEYPVIVYANKHLPKNSKILGIFMGNRRYYNDKEMVFNDRLLFQAIGTTKSPELLFGKMKKRSITHIIIWESYFIQWVRLNYSNKELIALHKFFNNYTSKIYSSRGYTLYQLDN